MTMDARKEPTQDADGSAGIARSVPNVRLHADDLEFIRREAAHYEEDRAIAVDAMKRVQRRQGWIDDDTLVELAGVLGMSPTELDGLATFYNLIYRRPVGRHVIHVCDSVSCWVCNATALHERLKQTLGVDFGETTSDGRFTLLPTVCLGACDRAPTLLIDGELHGNVAADDIDRLLDQYA